MAPLCRGQMLLAVVHIRDDVIILRWCHRTISLKHLHPIRRWIYEIYIDALLGTPKSTSGSKQRTCWTAHTHTPNHIDVRLLKVRPHAKWERSREVCCLHIYMSVIQLSQYTRCTCRPTLGCCIHRCVHQGYTRTTWHGTSNHYVLLWSWGIGVHESCSLPQTSSPQNVLTRWGRGHISLLPAK